MCIEKIKNRIVIGLEYDGTNYHGWQSQKYPIVNTIQGKLIDACSKVNSNIILKSIVAAGRTDKGVHAKEQVVHFDSYFLLDEIRWKLVLNRYLPENIAVNWVKIMDDNFHARFSAIAREYSYWIIFNENKKKGLWSNNILYVPYMLNISYISESMKYLIGEKDFSSFRSSGCQSRSPLRKMFSAEVIQHSKNLIELKFKADSFLYHMVRNLVGSLLLIGKNIYPPNWMNEALLLKNRNKTGAMVPPNGLYLNKIYYSFDLS